MGLGYSIYGAIVGASGSFYTKIKYFIKIKRLSNGRAGTYRPRPSILFLWWPFISTPKTFLIGDTFLTIAVLFMIKTTLFDIEIIQFSILVRWRFLRP